KNDAKNRDDLDLETNRKYCGSLQKACKFLFIYSLPLTHVDLTANSIIHTFSHVARHLDRTMVLPDFSHLPYCIETLKTTFPTVNFISQSKFERWTRERFRKPIAQHFHITNGTFAPSVISHNEPTQDNSHHSVNCFNRFDIQLNHESTYHSLQVERDALSDLRKLLIKSFLHSDAEVLLIKNDMDQDAGSHPVATYSTRIAWEAWKIKMALGPYVAVHWKMEEMRAENMHTCVDRLKSKLMKIKNKYGIQNVYLSTDYPISSEFAHPNSYKRFKQHHHRAILMLNSTVNINSWISLGAGELRRELENFSGKDPGNGNNRGGDGLGVFGDGEVQRVLDQMDVANSGACSHERWETLGERSQKRKTRGILFHLLLYVQAKDLMETPDEEEAVPMPYNDGICTCDFFIIANCEYVDETEERENYDPVKYLDLDPNLNFEFPLGTTVYHITREFHKSTRSNIGRHVTALASAQSADGSLSVNIVMPYYSFLKHMYKFSSYCKLRIRIRDEHGKWKSVKFSVHRFWLNTQTQQSFPAVKSKSSKQNLVRVFMIGQSSQYSSVFRSNNVSSIYSAKRSLPSEFSDVYFCKAAAELVTYLNVIADVSLFSESESRGADVVHIHGSINALAVEFIKEFHKDNNPQNIPSSTVYTLHDHYDEQLYSVGPKNLNRFVDAKKFRARNLRYFRGDRLFPSPLGINGSNVATFVSKEGAQYIVERTPDFYMRGLIMPSILLKAENRQWVGINRDLDPITLSPFDSTVLLESNSIYPDNIDSFNVDLFYAEVAESMELQPLIHTAKMNAKKYLIREGLLEEEDLKKPLLFFTGNFGYHKGFQFFDSVAGILKKHNAKIMIVVPKDDLPRDEGGDNVEELMGKYPDEVMVFHDEQMVAEWEALFRAAADMQFLPLFKEPYGMLDTVGGFLFGNMIVGSGTRESIELFVNETLKKNTDKDGSDNNGQTPENLAEDDRNDKEIEQYHKSISYFSFDFDPRDLKSTIESLDLGLELAVENWKSMESDVRNGELFLRKLIKDAQRLIRNSKNDEIERYKKVYKVAMLQTNDELVEAQNVMET
ncbi:14061_t:CDS:2, partial [Acaulospora colombiana]